MDVIQIRQTKEQRTDYLEISGNVMYFN